MKLADRDCEIPMVCMYKEIDGKNLEGNNFQMVLVVKIAIYRERGAN